MCEKFHKKLIKASNIFKILDQKKHDRFFLETKLDTMENILESRTLKTNQLRDEVFDKPADLEKLRDHLNGIVVWYADCYSKGLGFESRVSHGPFRKV
jgi:hypothetical protein